MTAVVMLLLGGVAASGQSALARTGYLQEGRYYASPAGTVAWMRVTDTAIMVSDNQRAVASIARADGTVTWSHHPSGGRIDAVHLTRDGRTLIVVGVDLEVLDAGSGKMRWAQRLGCKRPCENRVQWHSDDALFVSGSGVTHQWLWRYALKDGGQAWPKPLAIAHPRGFVGAGASAWLLEANAPFGIRLIDLGQSRTVSRALWRAPGGAKSFAAQRIDGLGDGRLLITGPLPGGGLPPMALASPAAPQPAMLSLSPTPVLAGARVTRVIPGGALVAAVGRRSSGQHALAMWHLDRPQQTSLVMTSTQPLTVLRSHDGAVGDRVEAMVVARQSPAPTAGVEIAAMDAASGKERFRKTLVSPGRARIVDVGEGGQPPSIAVAMVPPRGVGSRRSGPGPLAIIDTATGALVGVGAVERASQVFQVQRTPTGLYVGAGGGVYSMLKVPLARAFGELQQDEADANNMALRQALQWVPEAAPRLAKIALAGAREGARRLLKGAPKKRLRGLTTAIVGLVGLTPSKVASEAGPLLTPLAGLIAASAPTLRTPWRELGKALEQVAARSDLIGDGLKSVGGLVVLTAVGLKAAGAAEDGMRLMDTWLARPTLSEPGDEMLRQVLALAALDQLFAGQVGALTGQDDAKRHGAARLLAAFTGAAHALGDSEWLAERARPVLTPSRPESMGAAAELAQELSKALEKATMGGRIGLSGPGCARTCHVLEAACVIDCHGGCDKRRRRCLNRCKKTRAIKVKARRDACRAS